MQIWELYRRSETISPKYIPSCQDPTKNPSFYHGPGFPKSCWNPSFQWNSPGIKKECVPAKLLCDSDYKVPRLKRYINFAICEDNPKESCVITRNSLHGGGMDIFLR